ncbi:MAG: hypothetical protein Q8N85_06450 [Candidatus Omnitrophota bacterium]|nr:hypothetical protein [Candidatus Omnitrophota bacterium]
MIDKALLKRILFILGAVVLCAAPFAYIFFPVKEIIPAKPKQDIPAETGNQSGLSTLELLRKQREELRLKQPRQEPAPPQENMPPAEGGSMPPVYNSEPESTGPDNYNWPENP